MEICKKRAGMKTLVKTKHAYATIIKISDTVICCEVVKRIHQSHDKRVDLLTYLLTYLLHGAESFLKS